MKTNYRVDIVGHGSILETVTSGEQEEFKAIARGGRNPMFRKLLAAAGCAVSCELLGSHPGPYKVDSFDEVFLCRPLSLVWKWVYGLKWLHSRWKAVDYVPHYVCICFYVTGKVFFKETNGPIHKEEGGDIESSTEKNSFNVKLHEIKLKKRLEKVETK